MEFFQQMTNHWMKKCFGAEVAADRVERNHRFLEEALELVQANDVPRDDVLALVDYVYGRPAGDPPQEVGGVMVTLAALCTAHDIDLDDVAHVELDRCWGKIEQIRAKQAAKSHGSPLPGPTET